MGIPKWGLDLARQWEKYRPPSRPSKSEARIYEAHIKKLPEKGKILLLGSTPEIRDFAAKYKKRIVLCDWSEDICRALGLLLKHKVLDETISKQDWRKMRFSEKFDMIIGDCATTVVPYKDLEKVLVNIRKCLKPGGVVIQRIWVRHPGQAYSVGDINRLFKTKPKGMHWYTQMLFPVFMHFYDCDKESLSGEEIYEKINEYYRKGMVSKELADCFSLVKNHKTGNNVLLKDDLEKILKKYFCIDAIEYGKDNFSGNAPVYFLRTR